MHTMLGRRSAMTSARVLLQKIAMLEGASRDIRSMGAANEEAVRHGSRVVRRVVRRVVLPLSQGVRGHWGRKSLRGWLSTAVMTGVLAAVAFLGYYKTGAETSVTHVYTTRVGQQATITLNDGTRIVLAPQTTLRVAGFNVASRTVTLEAGEAYFTVASVPGVPFTVRSGVLTAQVLGTEFLVRHDRGEHHLHVAVVSGKVRMTTPSRAASGLTLTAGQIGDMTDSTVQVSRLDDVAAEMEWVPGHLLFRNTLVSSILQTVSRWYGYRFRYADSALAQQRLTIDISTQSSAEALASIERILLVNLTVVGDTVTLTPQPTRSTHGTPRAPMYDVWTPTREAGR